MSNLSNFISKSIIVFGGSFKNLIGAIILFITALGVVLAPIQNTVIFAQNQGITPNLPTDVFGGPIAGDQNSILNTIVTVAQFIVFVFAGVCVLIIIWGGIRWGTDSGDGKGAETGKKIVINGAIGLTIAALSFLIIRIIFGIIGAVQGAFNQN